MEFIYNWNNNLIPDRQDTMTKISNIIDGLTEEGFSTDEALDLMVGDGYDFNEVKNVIDIKKRGEDAKNNITTDNIDVEPNNKIPASYKDIQNDIENLLNEYGAENLYEIIAGKNDDDKTSIVKMSKKEKDELSYLIKRAAISYSNDSIDDLHYFVKPYIEDVIGYTQLLASNAEKNGLFKFSAVNDDVVMVEDNDKTYTVNLNNNTCTCPRYIIGSFKHTGLVCEHIIEAHRNFTDDFEEETYKKVYAHVRDGERYGWCDRFNDEVKLSFACANCPYYGGDGENCIKCKYRS